MIEHPPRWAQTVLQLLLPPADAEAIVGDLLEEYRDAKVPALGRSRAGWWYARQVAGFWLRLSGAFGLAAGATHAWRTLIDHYVPTNDFHTRAAVLTYTMIAICLMAGLRAAYRTGRALSGVLAASAAMAIGAAINLAVIAAIVIASGGIQTDPGGLSEVLFLAVMTLPIAAALGAIGGLAGRFLTPTTRPRARAS